MIDPNYLPFILAAGGVVLLAVFFHYVPFFLWLSAKYQVYVFRWFSFF